jgi:hypothetical protein
MICRRLSHHKKRTIQERKALYMKTNTSVYLVLTIFLAAAGSCSKSSNVVEPVRDIQNVKVHLQYGFADELDTFRQTFQKDLVMDGTIRSPFWLTSGEQDAILQKAMEIGFFSFPDSIQKEKGVHLSPDPSPDMLRIQYQGQDQTVVWFYPPDPNEVRVKPLLELQDLIVKIIQAKPEYKALPPANGGYL